MVLIHVDCNPDLRVHIRLAERGAFLQYDTPGRTKYQPEGTTIFASDWPHHDFDHPSKVHQIPFSNEVRRKVFGDNALRLFKIDAQGRRLNL